MKLRKGLPRNQSEDIIERETLLMQDLQLTSWRRLKLLNRLYYHLVDSMQKALTDISEDMHVWGAPPECYTGAQESWELSLQETMEHYMKVLFPNRNTRDAEIYGVLFISLMRNRRFWRKGYRTNQFHDLISYLKYSMWTGNGKGDGDFMFLVNAEEVNPMTKDDILQANLYADKLHTLEDEINQRKYQDCAIADIIERQVIG